MRCLALATAWLNRGGSVTFACQKLPGLLKNRLVDSGCDLHELMRSEIDDRQAIELQTLAEENLSHWIVMDGYRFGDDYVRAIKSDNWNVLVISDDPQSDFPSATALLNQNVYADANSCSSTQRQLLGTKYALLRPEFANHHASKIREPGQVPRALVTCGGSDRDNVTGQVIDALEQGNMKEMALDVVVGACNPNSELLRRKARESMLDVRLHHNVDRMNTLISRADLAITAGGSTCYELAHYGIPFVVLPIARNQVPVADGMHACQVGFSLDMQDENWKPQLADKVRLLTTDRRARREMSDRGKKLVDGQGAARVCRALKSMELNLQPVSMSDAEQLFNWRTDQQVVAASFHEPPADLESHCRWLERRLSERDGVFFIARNIRGHAIGQVRIDVTRTRLTGFVGVSIDRAWRGSGYASAIIEMAQVIARAHGIQHLIAQIKLDNLASIAAFKRAGFEIGNSCEIHGQEAMEMVVNIESGRQLAA